jgi:hypothetical protein
MTDWNNLETNNGNPGRISPSGLIGCLVTSLISSYEHHRIEIYVTKNNYN